MRPMALDDLGLEAALSQLVQKLAQRGIVYARFEADGKRYDLPKHVEIAVFRIVQEALANVAHHSGQNKAMVRMLYSTGALSVLIEDHGCGFDMDADQKAQGDEDAYGLGNQESHFGMVSMEERARLIGAELQVTSKPGKGTRVHLRVERNVSRAAAEEKQAKEAARQVQAARQQERKAAEAKEAAVKARQEAARLAAKGQELAVEVEPAEKA